MRQLGGSVGIATARLLKLKAYVIAHGAPEALAQTKALWLLDGIVRKQAAMLAFERLFLLFGIMLLASLPLLLPMKRGRFMRQDATRLSKYAR